MSKIPIKSTPETTAVMATARRAADQAEEMPPWKRQETEWNICYCGHLRSRHGETCVGRPRGPECACKKFQAFPFGTYVHCKTGNVYVVEALGFNHETLTVEVHYVNVDTRERWHRPLYTPRHEKAAGVRSYGFLEIDPDTGKLRFEKIE